jgi:hypothetical protein
MTASRCSGSTTHPAALRRENGFASASIATLPAGGLASKERGTSGIVLATPR